MKDVLLITWHGIHELEIFPGLPDTGGQNIYVENLGRTIHDLYRCRVVILNRGGFPHPYTGRMREGYSKDPDRELYVLHVADDVPAFLRKEYLTPALIEQASIQVRHQLPAEFNPSLIVSNFWDGGVMGDYLEAAFPKAPHLWIPHEPVGMKREPLPETHYDRHSIQIREHCERLLMKNVDLVGSTSKLVTRDLQESYAGAYNEKLIDIFPGVDTERFRPLEESEALSGGVWRYHAEFLNLPEAVLCAPHLCEFGRSDALKDKDKAVEVFARVAKQRDDIQMFLNLDEKLEPVIAGRIHEIIRAEDLADRVHVLSPEQLPQSGRGSEIFPDLLRTAKVFLTMSVMEGFGMAACEAAASAIPVVGTKLIPVLTDVIEPAGGGRAVDGKDVDAAAKAVLEILDLDDAEYREMARAAKRSVIPRYTWPRITESMFDQIEAKGLHIDLERRGRRAATNGAPA